MDPYDLSLELIRTSKDPARRPQHFELEGATFELFEDVINPDIFSSTGIFTALLPIVEGMRMLEIGCGAGATSILCAQRGCAAVVATDISSAAVANTKRNVELHGLGDKVAVVEGDLYGGLGPGGSFDLIYWNSNFILVPEDHGIADPFERAVFDPGYATHKRYIGEAGGFLAPGGRLMLGFSNLGDRDLLDEAAEESGYRVEIAAEIAREEAAEVRYQLLEFLHLDRPRD